MFLVLEPIRGIDNATLGEKLCQHQCQRIQELKIAKILKVSGDKISIEFLDEQLSDAKSKIKQNRKIALKKGGKMMPTQCQHIATAMPTQMTIIREDKTKEKIKKIREYGPTHEHFVIVSKG